MSKNSDAIASPEMLSDAAFIYREMMAHSPTGDLHGKLSAGEKAHDLAVRDDVC